MIFDFIKSAEEIIKKVIPDQSQANTLLLELSKLQNTAVISEAQGQSWLQRNWRPVTMLVFVTIITNNYLIYPYISLFWHSAPYLTIPDRMWNLVEIGLGGYVFGRTGEKIASIITAKK